eukprot:5876515-Prymnesium_polylepis.1
MEWYGGTDFRGSPAARGGTDTDPGIKSSPRPGSAPVDGPRAHTAGSHTASPHAARDSGQSAVPHGTAHTAGSRDKYLWGTGGTRDNGPTECVQPCTSRVLEHVARSLRPRGDVGARATARLAAVRRPSPHGEIM